MGNCWFRFLKIKSSGRILINNATDDLYKSSSNIRLYNSNKYKKVWWVINRISYGGWIGATGGGTSIRYETTWISGSQQFYRSK
jgi:hypothetical protein